MPTQNDSLPLSLSKRYRTPLEGSEFLQHTDGVEEGESFTRIHRRSRFAPIDGQLSGRELKLPSGTDTPRQVSSAWWFTKTMSVWLFGSRFLSSFKLATQQRIGKECLAQCVLTALQAR
mmetsp:Transcript_18626/g.52044  ORF Transcript_18626/g.52044 Transcript_18626/m.52044 type:complete len:119 (-) Transcript_18626:403-759(-)